MALSRLTRCVLLVLSIGKIILRGPNQADQSPASYALAGSVGTPSSSPAIYARQNAYSSATSVADLRTAYLAGTFDPKTELPSHFEVIRNVHGALATFAWLILFPIGALIIRFSGLQPTAYIVWLHAKLQMAAYVVFIAAAGMGIWMAKTIYALTTYHPIIGMTLLTLLIVQPITEMSNHLLAARFPIISRIVIYIHLWLGRLLLALGIINGGLGFHFAGTLLWESAPMPPRIAYAVVASLVWIIYIGFAVVYPRIIDSRGWGHKVPLGKRDESEEMALMRPNQYASSTAPQTPVASQMPPERFEFPAEPVQTSPVRVDPLTQRTFRDPLPEPAQPSYRYRRET